MNEEEQLKAVMREWVELRLAQGAKEQDIECALVAMMNVCDVTAGMGVQVGEA
jgi:hypothetical protein